MTNVLKTKHNPFWPSGISVLTVFAIVFLFSCKKNSGGTFPTISYPVKNISFAVDAQMAAATPALGGGTITSITISPDLPKGISINPTTGVISGQASDSLSPTQFIVTAVGPNGMGHDTLHIAIGTDGFNYGNNPNYIFTNGDQTLSTTPLAPTIIAGNFKQFFIFPDSLTIKTGLAFDPTTGKISGIPNKLTSTTTSAVADVFTITGITAENKATSATLSVTVNDAAPVYSYAFTGNLAAGVNYVESGATSPSINTPILSVSKGSVIKAYRLAPNSPALPAGLSLDSTNGKIYGTPTTAGTTNVIIRALSAGGANPTDFTVPVAVTATVQTPVVNYDMIVYNKFIPSTGGSPIASYDTIVSSIASNATIYLTNNTSLSATGGYQGSLSGTGFQISPITTAGQVASFAGPITTLTGLSLSTSTGTITGTPKIVASTATATITLNDAISSGSAGSYIMNVVSNAPYITYNTPAGAVGSTQYCASSGRSYAFSNSFFFIRGRAVNASPNGTDSCYYTAAQLSPVVANSPIASYSIYPAQLLPGLSFNTTTGVLSGTPTINTSAFTSYNFVSYTIAARKADGSFTTFEILVKVFDSVSDYQNPALYP